MTQEELNIILDKHKKWLNGEDGGERADFSKANLHGVNFRGVSLYGADLREANFCEVSLYGADLCEAKGLPPLACPEYGSFIGWKKCENDKIVKLEICEDALRTSATTRKCRCSAAKVLEVQNLAGTIDKSGIAISINDAKFIYRVGEIVTPTKEFDTDRWNECSTGIHFFITRQEAVEY